jgi:ER membrane protein complex subunit 1
MRFDRSIGPDPIWQFASAGLNGTGILRAGEDQDIVIGAVGNHVAAWTAADGRIVWETRVDGATVEDLELLEQEDGMTNNEAKDALILLSDQGLKRLDGKTGRVKWTYQDTRQAPRNVVRLKHYRLISSNSGDTPFQVSTSPTTIFYIALHTQLLGGSKLRVTSLSPITGKKIDQYTLSSEGEVQASEHVLYAGANTAAPLLAWTDKSNKAFKVNIIGTKGVSTFNAPTQEAVERMILHAPNRVNSLVHFLIEYQTATGHSAEVFHVDLKWYALSKAYSLPHLKSKGTFTTTTSDANVYFTRITREDVTVVSSVSHGILGRWPVKLSSALVGAYPVHGASEVVMKGASASAVRSAVLFSNGQWALVRNGEIAWCRPEFLSRSTSAVWADLPETEALAHELEVEGHQDLITAYIHRLKRHVRDLEHLPGWLQNIPNRVLGSLTGQSQESKIKEVKSDTFGFHKLVVLATSAGQLAALDVGSQGKLVWQSDLTQLAAATAFEVPSLRAYRGYVEVKYSADLGTFYINSTTGETVPSENIPEKHAAVQDHRSLISFVSVDGQLKGFLGSETATEAVWTFTPPNGEKIVSYIARPAKDPVASIGRVLGDRRVLYKYLNPNLVLVTAVLESAKTASFYLLDSASGQLLHSITHADVDVSQPMPSTLSENWLSYSLVIDGASGASSRGYQLVVAELFESPLPDDRGPLGASSNSSTLQPSDASGDVAKPYVLSQTYQIPELISHMTVTQTSQGITSRELLVTLPRSNSIVGIPRHVIDPRRPIGRDPTSQEQSEGLTKYAPLILFDPKWHLNHKYEVAGVQNVITSESGLESTSLVFAYGFDVFGTRVAPSFAFDVLGKGFNKIQMLLTVAALFVGVLFVAPLVSSNLLPYTLVLNN